MAIRVRNVSVEDDWTLIVSTKPRPQIVLSPGEDVDLSSWYSHSELSISNLAAAIASGAIELLDDEGNPLTVDAALVAVEPVPREAWYAASEDTLQNGGIAAATVVTLSSDFPAGDYEIHWELELLASGGASRFARAEILLDDVVINTAENMSPPSGLLPVEIIRGEVGIPAVPAAPFGSYAGSPIVYLEGEHTIAIKHQRLGASGASTIRRARIRVERVVTR